MIVRTLWRALLLLFLIAPWRAFAADAPLFPLDAIRVEGRASREIVVAESKLEEGRTYSEPELRDAMARISRLPFVVRSNFRLEKGTERGHYVLVITIIAAKPVFFSYRAVHEGIDVPRRPGEGNESDRTLFRHNEDYTTVGARLFVGSKGVAHAAVDQRGSRFSLGYTQYDLFDTRASVSALVQYRGYGFDLPDAIPATGKHDTSFTDQLAWQLSGAVPLAGNNAIRATWYRERFPFLDITYDEAHPDGQLNIRRRFFDDLRLDYIHDTTDDPVFPTEGTYVKAGVQSRHLQTYKPAPIPSGYVPRQEWQEELNVRIDRYAALTPRQAIWGSARGETHNERQLKEYTLLAGYGAHLWRNSNSSTVDELRFEAEIQRILLHYDVHTSYGTARLGLAFRNTWGVARLDFQYVGWRHRP